MSSTPSNVLSTRTLTSPIFCRNFWSTAANPVFYEINAQGHVSFEWNTCKNGGSKSTGCWLIVAGSAYWKEVLLWEQSWLNRMKLWHPSTIQCWLGPGCVSVPIKSNFGPHRQLLLVRYCRNRGSSVQTKFSATLPLSDPDWVTSCVNVIYINFLVCCSCSELDCNG